MPQGPAAPRARRLIPIPNTQGGKLWALAAMPWSRHEDPQGALIHLLRREMVDGVVVLAPCEEVRRAAGKDLLRWYRRQGMEPLHLPFAPEGVPERAALREALTQLQHWLAQGRHVVAHGHGEMRRVGFLAAAWLRWGERWPTQRALLWLARQIPAARLSPTQRAFLEEEGPP